MTRRFLILFLALDVLLAVTGVAIYQHGLIGFFQDAVVTSANLQILVDLCIAMGLFVTWMWRDAKKRGKNPLPYALAIVVTGSIAALVYLLQREWANEPETSAPVIATA